MKTASHHDCLQEWGKKLDTLGVTWDTFRHDKEALTKEMLRAGIPLLATLDIVQLATKEAKRATTPLAIWRICPFLRESVVETLLVVSRKLWPLMGI